MLEFVQWLANGMKEVMLGFPEWICAVLGYWHNGGHGWKLGFVQ